MRYEVITGTKLTTFNEKINARLNDGWILQGGVTASGELNFMLYAQAMIKESMIQSD